MLYYHMESLMRLASPVLAALCLAITGAAHADAPRVVADIAPVQSLVARVMDGAGAPELLIRPDASPHAYAMRPSEARALEQADLVVWMGPGLTPWLGDPIETLAPEAAHLSLLTAPETLILPGRIDPRCAAHDHDHDHGAAEGGGHDDHDDHDHEAGHDHDDHKDHNHEAGHDHDDHKDHDHEAGHDHDDHAGHDHAAAGQAELSALSEDIAARLAPLADRSFLVFHDAYQYFENRFGLGAAGALSIGDASEPSPARLVELRALAQ